MNKLILSVAFILLSSSFAWAQSHEHNMDHDHDMMDMDDMSSMSSLFCPEDQQALDLLSGMCFTLPQHGKEFSDTMIHGNLFVVGISQEGPRGDDRFASPNMLMADYGKSFSSGHTLGVNLMLTAEKWTFPTEGYPELFQIGEENHDGVPYIDHQHPHSSPIMGLTFSDVYRWNDNTKNYLKVFFAPRGQTTEGPIAFMHRSTGVVNPDAPLGHHVGQDVGHISSTVLGGAVYLGKFSLELSAFHGQEPSPDVVELQMGPLDSGAARLGYQLAEKMLALASFAYVGNPEHNDPEIKFYRRYSLSFYNEWTWDSWNAANTFIFGRIENMDLTSELSSFAEEFALNKKPMTLWGRLEVLQRTPDELMVDADNPGHAEWITMATLGYTHLLTSFSNMDLQLGASVSKYFIPGVFHDAYGNDPWAGKIFLQLSGMKMWHSGDD